MRVLILITGIFSVFVIFSYFSNVMAARSIEVTAGERSHPLGTLYNSALHEFYETWPVNGEIPGKCIRTSHMMEISYKSSVIISKQDLLDALELDATMKLTIMSGLFSAGITASYQDASSSTSTFITALTAAKVPTLEEKLNINCGDLDSYLVTSVLQDTKANYFVSSVITGFRYYIFFKAEATEYSSSSDVKASLTAYLDKLTAAFEANMGGAQSHVETRKDIKVTFTVKGHATLPDEDISSYAELIKYVKQVNSAITEDKDYNNGTAMYYVLTPIKDLFKRAGVDRAVTTTVGISTGAAKRALFVMEAAETVYNEASELGTQLKNYGSCIPRDQFKFLSRDVLDYQVAFDEFKANISEAMEDEGNEQSSKINKAIDYYNSSVWYPDKFEEKLRKDYKSQTESLATLKSLLALNINCLPVNVGMRDVPLRYNNVTVLIFQYWTNMVQYYHESWATNINEMAKLCKSEAGSYVRSVHCFEIDCMFNPGLCTEDKYPLIRVAYEGQFVDLVNQTATEFVRRSCQFPVLPENPSLRQNISKFELMKESLSTLEKRSCESSVFYEMLFSHFILGDKEKLTKEEYERKKKGMVESCLDYSCYTQC